MKKIMIIYIFLLTSSIFSTNVRGYIQIYNNYYGTTSPYQKAIIEIFYWDGYQWVYSTYTYSGYDGFYYFYNMPQGYYYLRVNKAINFNSFFIYDTNFQDVLPITITY